MILLVTVCTKQMLSEIEPQLSVIHVDTHCTKWIACCDLGDSQSTSKPTLVQHI